MKTNKIKIITSIIAILFAINGALSSHASEKKSNAPVAGYISSLDSGICALTVQCGYGGVICTIPYRGQTQQAFGKIIPGDPVCTKILYSPD